MKKFSARSIDFERLVPLIQRLYIVAAIGDGGAKFVIDFNPALLLILDDRDISLCHRWEDAQRFDHANAMLVASLAEASGMRVEVLKIISIAKVKVAVHANGHQNYRDLGFNIWVGPDPLGPLGGRTGDCISAVHYAGPYRQSEGAMVAAQRLADEKGWELI